MVKLSLAAADAVSTALLGPSAFAQAYDRPGTQPPPPVREACAAAIDSVVEGAQAAARRSGDKKALQAIVESYLSTAHRNNRSGGCPLAGLGSELARADDQTREAASAGFLKLVELVAQEIRRKNPEAAKADAVFALSAMIGAVTMSRIVTDPELSASILQEAKKRLCPLFAEGPCHGEFA